MTDINKDILEWLYSQKNWLQLTAIQLLEKGELSDQELNTILDVFKTPDGHLIAFDTTFPNLEGSSSSTENLRLVSIGNIHGIGTLSPRSPLTFGKGNLAVIYGHNGSGKSGYTRLLKKISGKPRAIELKQNVYEDVPQKRQCTVVYQSNCTEKTVEWIANTSPIADLIPIDIFDSEAAGFYLSNETEVSYVPEAVSLFEKLAAVCDQIKTILQQEQSKLLSALPQLPHQYIETSAGKDFQSLISVTTKNLKQLIEWSDSDKLALEQISERLKVADPAVIAKQKRNKQQQIKLLVLNIRNTVIALSNESIDKINKLKEDAVSKRRMAIEAAKINTSSAKLEGIGSDTWSALWNAARDYSALAYPEKIYPVTKDNARCVLCHQELNADAQKRMKDFETYVQSVLSEDALLAENLAQAALDKLPKALTESEIRTQCEAAGLSEESWLTCLVPFWSAVKLKTAELKTLNLFCKVIELSPPDTFLSIADDLSTQLDEDIKVFDADVQNFNRLEVEKQKLGLEARNWVSQQTSAILSEIARLAKIAEYEKWKKLTNSKIISTKADEISQKVITEAYVQRFNQELIALGASRIKVELIKTNTSKGKSKHRIRLKGAKIDHNSTDSVLSEGERRVVALAAFLADVTGKPNFSPFIFDDPISSLDVDFEWEVAVRLALLAKERQVLVFTHRLSLYGAMEDAAKKISETWKDKQLEKRSIEHFAGSSGHPVNDSLLNSNTKDANQQLIIRLTEAKKCWDDGNSSGYKLHAQGICTDFRKLIERTVEDDLLNQIVRRHRKSITTDNRIGLLPLIAVEDCNFIDGLMTKYSCFEHSHSQELPSFIPDEPALRKDVEDLKVWRESYKARLKKGLFS